MNQQTDFLNKLSIELIKNYKFIYLENANIKVMLKNQKLTKNNLNSSRSSFVTNYTTKLTGTDG